MRFTVVALGSRALLRLAPSGLRHACLSESEDTIVDLCRDAHARRGWIGVLLTVWAEWWNLIGTATRERLGRRAPISAPPRSPEPSRSRRSLVQVLSNDIRLALRGLRAGRAQVAIAIVTLALGIGINGAVFSILDSIVLRPVPFRDADRLVEVWNFNLGRKFQTPGMTRAQFIEWRKQTDLFDRFEGYDSTSIIFDSPRGAQMVHGALVTPGAMPMLNVQPLLGRVLNEGDGREGSDARVVVSETFWRASLGGRPDIVGAQVSLNGRQHEVVGVMPATFRFPYAPQQMWLPVDIERPPASRQAQALNFDTFARLAPARTLEQVNADALSRGEDIHKAAGLRPGTSASVQLKGAFKDEKIRTTIFVLSGAVGFLLLIVCANVANLSLARALSRTRDVAVRASLGASRHALIRETLVEHLAIGVVGSLAGIGVAWLTLQVMTSYLPSLLILGSLNVVDLDPRVVGFSVLAGIVSSVLFGLPPAILGTRPAVVSALKGDTRVSTGTPATRRLRNLLVVAEVTIALVLLVGTALMGRSLIKLMSVDRGFDTTNLVALRIGLPAATYTDFHARDRYIEDLLARLRTRPGVRQATAGSVPPDSSNITFGSVEFADGRSATKDLVFPIYDVWPGYFQIIGLPLREGREFSDAEPAASVIVSESFARDHWPGRSAVGQQFRIKGSKTWKTIVGVGAEVRQLDLDDAYGSYEWFSPLRTPLGTPAPTRRSVSGIADYRTVIVRTTDASASFADLESTVHQVDPGVVVWEATRTVEGLFADSTARPRLTLVLLAVVAGLGLVLAAAGLYGVLSYQVSLRTREFGIRLALGAEPASVFALILKHGVALSIVGVVVGVVASSWLSRALESLLYDVNPTDPAALAIVSVVLVLTAVAACWRPARRAMRVDPVSLLRD